MNRADKEVADLLKENPEQGIIEAIQIYGKTVQWIVYQILGDTFGLEECVSDVFVRLWKSISRFDETRGVPLASWVYSIARHTALDYRRKSRKISGQLSLEETELAVELNLDDNLAREENGKILRQVLDEMMPPDREIFLYRYFMELPVKEIAARLHLDEKQVENKLYRGRIRLRKELLRRGVIR